MYKLILHLIQEENSQLIDSLRSALRQQKAELEQLRHNLESVTAEKSHLSKLHDELWVYANIVRTVFQCDMPLCPLVYVMNCNVCVCVCVCVRACVHCHSHLLVTQPAFFPYVVSSDLNLWAWLKPHHTLHTRTARPQSLKLHLATYLLLWGWTGARYTLRRLLICLTMPETWTWALSVSHAC